MAGSVYLRRVQAINRNQQTDDVSRGMNVGQEVGKLLGGLAGAIKSSQKDALANKMMNTLDAPRAALVSSGGPQPGGPQTGTDSADPNADLSTDLPEDVSQTIGGTAPINQAVAAARLSSPNTGPDPDPDPVANPPPSGAGVNPDYEPYSFQDMPDTSVNSAANQAKAASVLSSSPAPAQNVIPAGVSTAGTAPHTGGMQELELMKEMQQMQAQKATMASAQTAAAAKAADAQAKASGTGQYAVDAAIKRAQLAAAQNKLNPKPAVPDKNAPPVDISSEPVTNQTQLTNYVDGLHGKGTAAALTNAVTAAGSGADLATDENGNQRTNIPITLSKNKTVNIPLGAAQNYVKQQNALLLKQNQPLLRVPGEDQTVGGTADNPYPAKNKLDALSRAHGTWVRLPTGQVAQVP